MPYATTPYNFIPLAGRVEQGADPPDADRFYATRRTGWFDVEITTLTPAYIREARRVEDSDEGEPSGFFWGVRDGKIVPLIPGSSLRGVVRSLFEIITCSHMEFISSRRLFYRSFASTVRNFAEHYQKEYCRDRLVAGVLLRNDQSWYLQVSNQPTVSSATGNAPAAGGSVKEHHGFLLVERSDPGLLTVADTAGVVHRDLARTDRSINETYEYTIQRSGQDGSLGLSPNNVSVEKATVSASGSLAGWLVAPGKDIQPRHYYQAILKPQRGDREYPVPDEVMEDYLAWGQMAHGARFGTTRAPRRLKEGEPAFALLGASLDCVDVIGANMMMPLRYGKSIKSVAEFSEGRGDVRLDMAQAVFGRVTDDRHDDSGSAGVTTREPHAFIKSRVFVEDAVCLEEDPWLKDGQRVKVPDVLSGPKPTAFQTYLNQETDLREQNLWDSSNARLRGRKLYWHRSPGAANDTLHDYPPAGVRDTQITRITPVREGVVFRGRVRFENLSNEELGALYASIQLPAGLAHKIGMGKNLGLGSVRIQVTDQVLLELPQRFQRLDSRAGFISGDQARPLLRQAYQAFLDTIKEYRQAGSLWKSSWTGALAAMLSWGQRPEDEDTRQIGVRGPGSEQWRYRWPLRRATDIIKVQVSDVFPLEREAGLGASQAAAIENRAEQPRTQKTPPQEDRSRDSRAPRRDDRTPDQDSPSHNSPRHFGTTLGGGPAPQKPLPGESHERTDQRKPTPAAALPKPTFREGERVNCKVISLSGSSGTVELPDGSQAGAVNLYRVNIGDTVKLRILQIGGDQKVKKLSP